MKITLKNCNNITEGTFNLELHKLNIKYAYNGTGKSTIARSIKAFAEGNQDEKSALTPYWSKGENQLPWMSSLQDGDEKIERVAIFNDAYINSYVFNFDPKSTKNKGKDEEFEVSIKTKDYESNLAEIQKMIRKLPEAFAQISDIDDAMKAFSAFSDSFKAKAGNKELDQKCDLWTAFGKGNKIDNVPEELRGYTSFLKCESNPKNFEWIKWVQDGQDYMDVDSTRCPFCSNEHGYEEKRSGLDRINKEYKRSQVEHLNEILQVLAKLSKFLKQESYKLISEYSRTQEKLTKDQQAFIIELGNQIRLCYEKFIQLKNVGQGNFDDIDTIVGSIKEYKIQPELYNHLNQEWLNGVASKVDEAMAEVKSQAEELQQKVKEQENLVSEIVETHNREINNFFKSAGYNYAVELNREQDKIKIVLKSSLVGMNIRGVKQHLSYGECNAFAMVIFLYTVIKENPDLIVLDDPISSFDGNKKFALLNLMFLSTKILENTTVLLLTHDFTTVVDIVGTLGNKVGLDYEAKFLTIKKGVCAENEVIHNILGESPITQGDIKSFKTIAMDHIRNGSADTLIKLIYLRRLIEFMGEKKNDMSLAYNMISCILHAKPELNFALGSEIKLMDDNDKAGAIKQIKEYICSFDFDKEWKRSHDKNALVKLYWSLRSNYEKIQVFRIICGPSMEGVVDDVVKKYIDETFHIENDSIFQLDPQKYDTVPLYIVEECDKCVSAMEV